MALNVDDLARAREATRQTVPARPGARQGEAVGNGERQIVTEGARADLAGVTGTATPVADTNEAEQAISTDEIGAALAQLDPEDVLHGVEAQSVAEVWNNISALLGDRAVDAEADKFVGLLTMIFAANRMSSALDKSHSAGFSDGLAVAKLLSFLSKKREKPSELPLRDLLMAIYKVRDLKMADNNSDPLSTRRIIFNSDDDTDLMSNTHRASYLIGALSAVNSQDIQIQDSPDLKAVLEAAFIEDPDDVISTLTGLVKIGALLGTRERAFMELKEQVRALAEAPDAEANTNAGTNLVPGSGIQLVDILEGPDQGPDPVELLRDHVDQLTAAIKSAADAQREANANVPTGDSPFILDAEVVTPEQEAAERATAERASKSPVQSHRAIYGDDFARSIEPDYDPDQVADDEALAQYTSMRAWPVRLWKRLTGGN